MASAREIMTEGELLGPVLRDVSRSFYKTLKLLPAKIRKQISLAYLLARTTDTIADTELVAASTRLATLEKLRRRILGTTTEALNFGDLTRQQANPAEALLLEQVETALALLQTLTSADQVLVRKVLDTITTGQILDLERFSGATPGNPVALRTAEELEDYAFRVAGCVGEFWTHLCRKHVFPNVVLDESLLVQNGIRFGKGLQLINILRDLPADLRKGRCYLPSEELRSIGLAPADLLVTTNEQRLRPVYDAWVARAESYLAAGWVYTNTIPWRFIRVRLACALPILIGAETLGLLRSNSILNPKERIKIRRDAVARLFRQAVVLYPLPSAWKKLPKWKQP
jgi:farnesyl-diphosphate farnesyltransferase